jgi:hypothetical protein
MEFHETDPWDRFNKAPFRQKIFEINFMRSLEGHKYQLLPNFISYVSIIKSTSGANPTIMSYYASVVKIYNATNSIASFQN